MPRDFLDDYADFNDFASDMEIEDMMADAGYNQEIVITYIEDDEIDYDMYDYESAYGYDEGGY